MLGDLVDDDTPLDTLIDSIVNPKVKTVEGYKVRACSLACYTLGVEGCVGTSGWGLG
jgi:hypothetical protein